MTVISYSLSVDCGLLEQDSVGYGYQIIPQVWNFNSIDGSEDDELFSEFIGGRDDVEQEENTEECDLYNDGLSEEQFYELFGDSDNK